MSAHCFNYTAHGGIAAISPKGVLTEGFLWDPEHRFCATKNNRQVNEDQVVFYDIHHYIYNPNGTRLMKASLKHDYTATDVQQLSATQHVLDPYTVDLSGNYVVKF
ncbi:MAG: hypothetical protein LAT76_11455 [Schleiferiaceae bacterium]|nr:hypothetical protein [Schleiferiaceae bacterium]